MIDVLTHENRPRMADTDSAYKDDVAPDGSPFRPLYDDRIMFSGQPIALVVAEDWEIARFAASLVRVDYEEEPHVTDLYRQRDEAVAGAGTGKPAEAAFAPPKPRGTPRRPSPPPRCATRANTTSRSSITTRWSCSPRR